MLGLFLSALPANRLAERMLPRIDNVLLVGQPSGALSMSQQLQRLEAKLLTSADVVTIVELTARIALVLSRLGRFDEAGVRVKVLREKYGDGRAGRIHLWIMLSEAILDWYANLSANALDRVTRVQMLSGAMGYLEMHAIASAWKAHIQFETSDFDGMLQSIDLAYQSSREENADANARLAIVLSSAFALCGDWMSAQKWFNAGRDYCLAEGDRAGLEALQYNRAVLSLTCIRAEWCTNDIDLNRVKIVRSEIDSSQNLNLLTKNSALANHLRLAAARLKMLESEFDQAINALSLVRNEAPFASYHFNQALIDLEIAYCQFRLNFVEKALLAFSTIDLSSLAGLDIDDQLAAAHACLEMAKCDPRFGSPDEMAQRKSDLAIEYSRSRAALSAGLQRFALV
jgi:hypothetical protein